MHLVQMYAYKIKRQKVFLADREAGKYQVARASWVADYRDPQNFLEVFSAEDNDSQYHSEDYNELIARIRTTPNGAERDALMHKAEQMIFDEALSNAIVFHNATICNKWKYSKLFLDYIGPC